jgi:hypothetical protein
LGPVVQIDDDLSIPIRQKAVHLMDRIDAIIIDESTDELTQWEGGSVNE